MKCIKRYKKYTRLLSILLLSAVLLTVAAGCRSDNNQVTVVLDWTINTNHTGLYVALENEYFKEEGLEVDIQAPPDTGAATLVAAGTAAFGISYQEEVTYSRAAGVPLKAIAAIIQNNTSGFASRREAGIENPGDFEDKRYGGWGSPIEEAMLQALMEQYGADYERLNIVSVGDMDFFAATERLVDFTWIFKGWDGVAAELRGIDINYISLGGEEPALNYYTPVIISNEEFIENHPETVRKFLNAVSRGYCFAIENPEAAADILLKYAPEMDAELVHASQVWLADEYQADAPRWGMMEAGVWEAYTVWLMERNLLDGEINTAEAFTNAFLPQ